LQVALVSGLFAALAAPAAIGIMSHLMPRPWFLVGGELYRPLAALPKFGPMVWKRQCLGYRWVLEQADGEYQVCAGVPRDTSQLYREWSDREPWAPEVLPQALRARDIARQIQRKPVTEARVLSWRSSEWGQDVLLVSTHRGGTFQMSVATWRRDREDWRIEWWPDGPYFAKTLDHRPVDAELTQFAASYWVESNPDTIRRWAIDPEAWKWAVGFPHPAALDAEIERVETYGAH
jgi:hypothetical protein